LKGELIAVLFFRILFETAGNPFSMNLLRWMLVKWPAPVL
jgi:hypothetical protein